ncbi:MAG: phytoene/squalene synthase family protein [Rhodobacteraceae bacterium]|jgi:phytoene synthase|nr:phytoene/squalene synthase family protein [Paracoccaceae bacterium]
MTVRAESRALAAADMAACREAIRTGSLSFHAASKLLPARVRDPALALYAFCRLADDAVDLREDKVGAVLRLRDRLDLVYAGRPVDAAPDRAFTAVVEAFELPRALPDALLEGFAWDAVGRRYHTLSELLAYAARVASAVGAMMCVLMRVRDRDALARACDLGAAMQLTNIARDVGEDAAAGRLYLPLDWLAERGVDPEVFLARPEANAPIRTVTRQLLSEAQRLYFRAEAGVAALPPSCRPGIYAARHIYAAIGDEVARAGHDSVTRRARTSGGRKAGLLGVALLRAGAAAVFPRSPVIYARPLAETAFLVEAAARTPASSAAWGEGRTGALMKILAELEARQRTMRPLEPAGARTS